jgi:hypothetical protein
MIETLCMPFPLRPGYLAQVVVPRDMTRDEAERLCAFVNSLAHDAALEEATRVCRMLKEPARIKP